MGFALTWIGFQISRQSEGKRGKISDTKLEFKSSKYSNYVRFKKKMEIELPQK